MAFACEQIHMRHLLGHLGGQRPLRGLTPKDLQAYIRRRLADSWHGKPPGGDTISREITTFRLVWKWAVKQGYLDGAPPWMGLSIRGAMNASRL